MARKNRVPNLPESTPSRMSHARAAQLLGCPEREVIDVEDSPAGPIITTFDGARMVLVDDTNPDAEGKTGLMLLCAPIENYRGSFPIYAQPGADGGDGNLLEPDADGVDQGTTAPVEPDGTGGQ